LRFYNIDGTRNLHASIADTNVVNHAGKTFALVESSLPWQIAPADSDAGELSGWHLSNVYDPARDGGDLVIIEASDFQGKPVARVQLPQRTDSTVTGSLTENARHGCARNWKITEKEGRNVCHKKPHRPQ
jgi:carotenoid cleavage dioxygenase-like enzyme